MIFGQASKLGFCLLKIANNPIFHKFATACFFEGRSLWLIYALIWAAANTFSPTKSIFHRRYRGPKSKPAGFP